MSNIIETVDKILKSDLTQMEKVEQLNRLLQVTMGETRYISDALNIILDGTVQYTPVPG